jgi:acyl transferase domain-containing protein
VPPTDVAIIGLACRFPGAANASEFWRLMCDEREITQLPDTAADFDADFFNLSPREARAMDPRQRLVLELTWDVFEDAFVVPETVRGQQVAVYLGAMNDDYAFLTAATDDVDHHSFAGISRGMIANRISFAFGLHGPSMTVDSGQSSSLVAVHLACESLRTGASALAIAGGVHLNLATETVKLETEFGAVSESGHTYAFDERADGYVRGEGAALVLLKPLRAALDDGDRIHAVIRGSAVGNAGESAGGLTVTSAPAIADVVARALASAGLDSSQVDYIEAHGAGTEIGDPVEARALGEVFAHRRQRPVSVGSVKTNIGHAGGAAGVAGLVKTVLAIENGLIPASLNFARAGVDLESLGLRINTTLSPWQVGDGPRRAGVSSFGMGGTNAHVVLEEPPPALESVAPKRDDDHQVVPWAVSALSVEALAGQAARLLAHVEADAGLGVADVGWSLVSTRSVFGHRAVVVGAGREQLLAGLAGLAAGEPGANTVVGHSQSVGKTVFVFPGQGSQWVGMGAELLDSSKVFADHMHQCDKALGEHVGWSLIDVIRGVSGAPGLDRVDVVQPALWAVMVSLTELWRSVGVAPDAVIGHSQGEIAAACVAGALSLEDAARVVALRSALLVGLSGAGGMVSLACGLARAQELVARWGARLNIAAVNGVSAVVASGEVGSLAELVARCEADGVRARWIDVDYASHSEQVDAIREPLVEALAAIAPRSSSVALFSTVTGELIDTAGMDAQYWYESIRRTVQFERAVRSACDGGYRVFIESSPHPILTAGIEEVAAPVWEAVVVPSLCRDDGGLDRFWLSVGQAHVAGVAVDWQAAFDNGRRIELPTYAFQRRGFWLGDDQSDRGGTPRPATSRPAGLIERLRELTPGEQHRQLVELVCVHAASVLGHASSDDIDAERAFQDLGFDSMIGVELRNRLKAVTGLTGLALSRTLIFDYPTPTALADHLAEELLVGHRKESEEEKIRSALRKIPLRELQRTGLLDKLLRLSGTSERSSVEPTVGDDVIDALSPDALIAMALKEADGSDN